MRSVLSGWLGGGGLLGPFVGWGVVVVIWLGVGLFLGIASAIYLSEYAKHGRFIEGVRLAILNLSGVPSVVFGLFGLGIFVLSAPVLTNTPLDRSLLTIPLGFTHLSFQGWDTCVLSGSFTLAFVILPVIITASEECLRAVPQGFRETSLALGATRWQTIRRSVLPFAMPGILTSSILGILRAAGETAPIMFTAALAFKDKLPWQSEAGWSGIFTESVQALPYHIYTIAARIPQSEYSERAQYGSVFVFLVLVLALAMSSVLLRRKLRAKYKW
jgi:phosphate transport system permease protein